MNKKLNIVLLGILTVFLMVTTASATNLGDHIAGVGTMAHPTSSAGIADCSGCHSVGSTTTPGKCTSCHAFPTFILSVSATPTSVTVGTVTPVQFTVRNGGTTGPKVTDASVSLTGAASGTSGLTDVSGLTSISMKAGSSGPITATATKTADYTSGTTTLTASAPSPVLTTISVSPSTANLIEGATQAFTAAPIDQFGNPIAATIIWTSSNTAAGTISATGVLTAVSAGSTTVTATSGSVSGTASVIVTAVVVDPVLTTITVSPSTANVVVGATQTFAAASKDQNGNNIAATITWTSSNSTVGTINSAGVFTAIAAGITTIKAANGTISGTATATVTSTVVVPILTTITVSPSTANVVVGATQAFTAAPKDQNGNPMVVPINWTSSNATVGNVDANGKFTASAVGTATIKAANGNVNGTATVTVTSTPTPSNNYIVTFIVTDNVTGKPIKEAKVSIDGVKKETNRSGMVVFKKVSPGKHTYSIQKEHYQMFNGSIEVNADMTISVKLTSNKKHDDDDESDDNESGEIDNDHGGIDGGHNKH